jgi:hypothetical protein
MAESTNTFKTYESIGNREDLIDIITTISPVETWVTSNTGSKKSMAVYHEWQTDALDAAAQNSVQEGFDAAASAIVATSRAGNYCQILQKAFTIAGTQEAINKAGRDSEIAYQTAKKAKELARDIEYALVINATASAGCSNNARLMKGLDGWISTNCTYGGTSVGASVTLSVGNLNDCLQTIWTAGGFPRYVLCGAFQKRKISDFSTNTRNVTADAKKLVQAVDVFLSDFGELVIKLHHQMNTTIPSKVIILGDMDHWNKAWLRPVKRTELAKTGDATKFQMIAELTLESLQEAGHGKIAGLKTA